MTRGLVVGRFQPFHRGHLEAVQEVSSGLDLLLIAIGSSQVSHTPENPFTGGERFHMVHEAVQDAGMGNVAILPLPDVNRNALWVRHVESLVPPFDVFFSNNGLPRRLFREAGYEVRRIPFHERERYSGTRIRRLLREGGDWESLVPPAVARVVEELDGEARMRDILSSDDPQDVQGGA